MQTQQTEDKVAVVTGGAGGIGAATALVLGRRGHRVVVADLDADAADSCAAKLRAQGLTAMAVQADVTDERSTRAMAEAVVGKWGRIDVLVNNAGIESMAPFLSISLAAYERVMRVNTTGAWLCCQAVVPLMQRQGGGAIVNVSQRDDTAGAPGAAAGDRRSHRLSRLARGFLRHRPCVQRGRRQRHVRSRA